MGRSHGHGRDLCIYIQQGSRIEICSDPYGRIDDCHNNPIILSLVCFRTCSCQSCVLISDPAQMVNGRFWLGLDFLAASSIGFILIAQYLYVFVPQFALAQLAIGGCQEDCHTASFQEKEAPQCVPPTEPHESNWTSCLCSSKDFVGNWTKCLGIECPVGEVESRWRWMNETCTERMNTPIAFEPGDWKRLVGYIECLPLFTSASIEFSFIH